MMKDFGLKQIINDANASGREYLFAPWINFSNTSFNSKEASQNGRSMIEMLGVLAIIGVLSVGGIAGYSKAMMKYRINKTIEQITLIAGNVRTFFAPQHNYDGLGGCSNDNSYCKLIRKAKLIPDEMWDDTDKRFKNVFGYEVNLYTAHKSTNTDKQAFHIDYIIPNDYDVCIELLSYDWTVAGATGVLASLPGIPPSGFTFPASLDIIMNHCTLVIDTLKKYNNTALTSTQIYFDVNKNCLKPRQSVFSNYCSTN